MRSLRLLSPTNGTFVGPLYSLIGLLRGNFPLPSSLLSMVSRLRVPSVRNAFRPKIRVAIFRGAISLIRSIVMTNRLHSVGAVRLAGLQVRGASSLSQSVLSGVGVLQEGGRRVRRPRRLPYLTSQRPISNGSLYFIFPRIRICFM